MTSTVSRTYPLAPLDLVTLMHSAEFQEARAERLGGIGVPTVTREGDVVVVRFPRRLPLDDLPGPLRSLAGTGEVTQVERWETITPERCAATWASESRLPGTAGGTFEVLPHDGGSTYVVVATVEIKVPLIGGRISKEAEAQVVKLVNAEMDFAEEFLAAR
jgi:hypothetical protein